MSENDQFRVVYGTGAATRYETWPTINQAWASAAKAIRIGEVSQVAVEERDNEKWALVRVGKYAR